MAYYGDDPDGDCQYLLEFDGASRSAPYSDEMQAGAGAALYVYEAYDEIWNKIAIVSTYLGHATCNQAEYSALILGLEAAYDAGVRNIHVRGDSLLVIKQVQGRWQRRSQLLRDLFDHACDAEAEFHEFQIGHIYRHTNQAADQLANNAIDGGAWEGMQNMDGEIIAHPRGNLPIWR